MTMRMTRSRICLTSLCASVLQAARYYFSASFFYFDAYDCRSQSPA